MKHILLFLALLFTLAPVKSAQAFNFITGVYSGNGADNRDISVSPSFAIDALLVKCDGLVAVMRTSTIPGDLSDEPTGGGTGLFSNLIQSLGTGIFQVGSDTQVNNSGTDNCFYAAWGKDANDDLSVEVDDADDGSYLGDGADNRDIVILPAFQPEAVILLTDSDNTNSWSVAALGGGAALRFANLANATNHIQALNANGFQVGTAVQTNESASNYYPIAIKAITGHVASGTYTANTGTCADNCSVSVGFQPDLIVLKSASTQTALFRTASMTGDLSCSFAALTCAADLIQSFTGSGFTYGAHTDVNTNGVAYYWLAIKIPVYVSTPAGPFRRRGQ